MILQNYPLPYLLYFSVIFPSPLKVLFIVKRCLFHLKIQYSSLVVLSDILLNFSIQFPLIILVIFFQFFAFILMEGLTIAQYLVQFKFLLFVYFYIEILTCSLLCVQHRIIVGLTQQRELYLF